MRVLYWQNDMNNFEFKDIKTRYDAMCRAKDTSLLGKGYAEDAELAKKVSGLEHRAKPERFKLQLQVLLHRSCATPGRLKSSEVLPVHGMKIQ